jgi:hypothetical protein
VALLAWDITEQKKSQQELRKFFQAIQQSPLPVVITDRDGTIDTGAEVIGKTPRILKSGHTPPEQYADLWNTITSGRVWRGEFVDKKRTASCFFACTTWHRAALASGLLPDEGAQTSTSPSASGQRKDSAWWWDACPKWANKSLTSEGKS